MKIAVLVKQVPDTESRITLNASGTGIDESDIKWVVNPYDEFAIEAALQLKQQTQGDVLIISAGPERVVDSIRTALAMGADRAIRIDTQGAVLDPFTSAVMLANCLKAEGVELVLGGKQAIDDDASQVLSGVAERLGWPVVSLVGALASSADGQTLTVNRPVSGGVQEVIDLTVPAVLGCDKGLNNPRYPSLPGIMKAKAKPLTVLKAADLLDGQSAQFDYRGYTLPPERAAGKKITGDAADVSEQLVTWLREEVKVL